jgi:Cytochrome bd terminal oxidase subunit I
MLRFWAAVLSQTEEAYKNQRLQPGPPRVGTTTAGGGHLRVLACGTFGSTVKGLNDFPADEWPQNVELLYDTYHIMVGLGTIPTLVISAAQPLD